MSKTYLLVSEGPSDEAVIKRIAESISEDIGMEITIRLLAPEVDATSGKHKPHGWTGVKNWCNKNKKLSDGELERLPSNLAQVRRRRHWESIVLFAGAAGLIIQMDSDIAGELGYCSSQHPSIAPSVYCQRQVNEWLGRVGEQRKLHVAVSNVALETWILATWDRSHQVFSDLPTDFRFQEITNVEDRLITLGLPSRLTGGRRRLRKTQEDYLDHGMRIRSNLEIVRAECEEVNSLCLYFSG